MHIHRISPLLSALRVKAGHLRLGRRQVGRYADRYGIQAGRQADRQTGREAHAGRWADR